MDKLQNPEVLCACGCGKSFPKYRPDSKEARTYLLGHSGRNPVATAEANTKRMKGKTYEEIYGEEEALRLKALRRNQDHSNRKPHPNRSNGSRARAAKTYEEIYGVERAEEERR